MNETKMTLRQKFIVNLINESEGIRRAEIEKRVALLYPSSKPTIARDLSELAKRRLIAVKGKSRGTVYLPVTKHPLLKQFDLEQYFTLEPDRRVGAKRSFDFSVFSHLGDLFSQVEINALDKQNRKFSEEVAKLDRTIYLKELERFVIELSWKSSKIEGNTYSLLETETLIRQSVEAKGRTKKEAIMILNHKQAFESIVSAPSDYKSVTLSKIFQLHGFLVKDLSISSGIREQAVGITGTVYKPLDNKWQIQEALEKLVSAINKTDNPLEKALAASSMISYIQPFADGNKRTGRMLANAILLAHDFFPLSYRSVDEETYKKALIVFYEQESMYHLKEIFVNQYRFALDTYFQATTQS